MEIQSKYDRNTMEINLAARGEISFANRLKSGAVRRNYFAEGVFLFASQKVFPMYFLSIGV
ncbi:hypothetical protein DFQ04_0091 [Algoriphagus boseongensis]|uniref:Uncharacterized protein n=1 Tax=Algoriphagus boseongensis TaxID=1442587 RepID=A0A4R6T827_9BACT|nr:hypothetical protein DFQ04_0091 [Algoriphagus boseongensis]